MTRTPSTASTPSSPSTRSRTRSAPHRTQPAPAAANGAAAGAFRAKVRMYRQGLGDCLLITLPRGDGSNYFILVDCGVLQGTANASAVMAKVVADIARTTNGKIDLLLATHQHWDHLSGFVQAGDAWKQLSVGQVWLAWTEDPHDDLARKLAGERAEALAGLRLGANRFRLAGDDENAAAVGSLLEFFGVAGGGTVQDALEVVRSLAAPGAAPRYCRPQDAPVELGDPPVRLYVLGPPRDEKLIKMTLPSTRNPETYGLVANAFSENVAPSLHAAAPEAPFSALYTIPDQVAQKIPFFKPYWATEAWRRIDTAWLAATSDFALQLDSATNNTSLVLAIELAGGDVLLFAGDAQVGNWLSWQDLAWTVDGRTVTGPDLLRRTIFYKVGHHGSHNATLQEKGLELMGKLQMAMIPVFRDMALQRHWGGMPQPKLVEALKEKTNGVVLQADTDPPAGLPAHVVTDPLYLEVVL